MTANFRKPGLLYPSQSTLALPAPAPFVTRFRPAPRRITRETAKKYRRAFRAAEQAAWDAATPAAQLRAHATTSVQDTPAEKFAFAALTVLAALGIVWGLVNMFHLVERWPDIIASVRALIG